MDCKNYYTDERAFAIRFVFKCKLAAMEFVLPLKYSGRFELNNVIREGDKDFVRIAQIKVKVEK